MESQADQLGVPIKNVLDVQSERLRVERKQMIQAKAAKAPIWACAAGG